MEVSSRRGRATKRQRLNSARKQLRSPSVRENIEDLNPVPKESIAKRLTATLSKEQRRSLWLAALSREELERVASGEDWHNDPLNTFCFSCKQLGRLLDCFHCPRAYHPHCLDPDQGEDPEAQDWTCPACSLLYPHGLASSPVTRKLSQLSNSPNRQSGAQIITVDKALESTTMVDSVQSKDMARGNSGKDGMQAPSIQQICSADLQSSSIGSATSRPFVIQVMSKGDNAASNKSRRVRLPDPSSVAPCPQFIYTHPESQYQHGNASSKSEQGATKKRSRYSTLPTEVDEALAIINRQLEVASHSKSMLEQATTRLHILEQDLIIERGKAKLNTSQSDKDAEINALQRELRLKQDIIDELEKKYELLMDEVKSKDLKIKDLDAWKLRMKMMIDGS